MSIPGYSNLGYYGGSDGKAEEAGQPYGGAIDTVSQLDESAAQNLASGIQIPALGNPSVVRYGAAYRKLEGAVGGTITSAGFYNRAGAITNSIQSIAQIRSSSPLDNGTVRIVGKEGGDWAIDPLTADGTNSVNGEVTMDATSFKRAEYLDEDGIPAYPVGNISVSFGGELVAVIFGTGSNYPNIMATNEVKIAVATAKDSTIGGTDWETPATGVGTYQNAVYWDELGDTSISVPSGSIANGEYCGFSIRIEMEGGVPRPVSGKIISDVDVKGQANG